MDGEEFDEGDVIGDGIGLGEELGETVFELCGVDAAGGGLKGVEQLEEAACVDEFGRGEWSIAAERAPGALDQLGDGEAGAGGCGGGENRVDAGEALLRIGGEQMGAVFDEAEDGAVAEGGVVGAGEGTQVGEGQAAPWSAQHRECGDAIGGMEQSAGKRDEIEDLLALGEGLDLDGAEGELGAAERGDDLGEVVAGAHEDGDAPGLGDLSAGFVADGPGGRWEGAGEPVGGDARDGAGVKLGLSGGEIGRAQLAAARWAAAGWRARPGRARRAMWGGSRRRECKGERERHLPWLQGR